MVVKREGGVPPGGALSLSRPRVCVCVVAALPPTECGRDAGRGEAEAHTGEEPKRTRRGGLRPALGCSLARFVGCCRRAAEGGAMAKVGEGDPRWLVSDRTDGRNVNGWHWEEKNALAWSKKRIHELLREAGRRPGETGEDRYAVRPPVREAPGACRGRTLW